MGKASSRENNSVVNSMGDNWRMGMTATLVYAVVAIYLYQPYFNRFGLLRFFIPLNLCIAALGAYALSRRWVFSFWASLFAGLIYGFGPTMLQLNGYHPTAGFMAAMIPWLFYPAAYGPKDKLHWVSRCLSLLPFLAIVTFFTVTTHLHLFAIPKQIKLHAIDLLRFFTPTVKINGGPAYFGFYHVPIVPLLMGFAMLIAAQRRGIIIIVLAGLVLAFSKSFLNVTPIMWATIPALCSAILIGGGTQALAGAGFSDRKWILMAAIVSAVLSVLTMLLALKYSPAFLQAAKMYMLGAVVAGTIFFMLLAKLRIRWVKMLILCLAMALDIFFGARYIVDMQF